jgi:hypothetical protein
MIVGNVELVVWKKAVDRQASHKAVPWVAAEDSELFPSSTCPKK